MNLNARTVGASIISNFDSLELNKNDELVAEVYQVECSEEELLGPYAHTSPDLRGYRYFQTSETKFIHDMNKNTGTKVPRGSPPRK